MCAGCLPVIEQHAGVVVTILIRGVEIGEGRIVGGRIRDIALGADELSSGDLVAVDDGAVEGGHEDDGLDAGCRQRVQDLEDVEDLGNVEDNGGGQDRQQVRHHDAERGGVLLAAWVAAVEDVRDAVDLVQHAEHPQHVGHHEHRHQRYASVVSHLPPDLGECKVGKLFLFW